MQEGTLVWKKKSIAVQYLSKGDLVFAQLKEGQEVEIFQNGFWHKAKVRSTTDEPFIEDWNYGNCLGCDIRFED